MQKAIALAKVGQTSEGGAPFGALVVKDGQIIVQGHNQVDGNTDCTEHAEMLVIREACKKLKSKKLNGCLLYTSCEPCLMCLGAIRWAGFDAVYYGASANDAKKYGFIYSDLFYQSSVGSRHKEFKLKQICKKEAVEVLENQG